MHQRAKHQVAPVSAEKGIYRIMGIIITYKQTHTTVSGIVTNLIKRQNDSNKQYKRIVTQSHIETNGDQLARIMSNQTVHHQAKQTNLFNNFFTLPNVSFSRMAFK